MRGNQLWINGDLSYNHEFKPENDLLDFLEDKLKQSPYAVRAGNHIEDRGSMVNFSVVGRDCSLEQRLHYFEYDCESNERNNIAEGELEVLRGNVIFLRENWNTGSGDNQLLSKQSNLKIASDGRLIGKTPLYTMFGNNQIHTAVFEKNFESRNQNLNAEGININIIENHIKIILELNNCK